jgi:hypothetical protein
MDGDWLNAKPREERDGKECEKIRKRRKTERCDEVNKQRKEEFNGCK